jgi:hypothetical protein
LAKAKAKGNARTLTLAKGNATTMTLAKGNARTMTLAKANARTVTLAKASVACDDVRTVSAGASVSAHTTRSTAVASDPARPLNVESPAALQGKGIRALYGG